MRASENPSSGADANSAARAMPERIGRYLVQQLLGRGGMATVYRVSDESTGRPCALKQLRVSPNDPKSALIVSLFEHEFRTLTELAHPRVIKVYDFGIAEGGPYYTMELLDGGDLTDNAPLPWREACGLLHDVCSSLALLHSRRLVHRDVSPHNVRCTPDGRAKLIDFGAMTTMGPVIDIVGTPPFVAPEVLSRGSIDARTDLFSLGVTLYYALTGRLPYPARSFADLVDVWTVRPAPPSIVVPDIPPPLDRLVLSLLSLERVLRPRSASEVMQQLAAAAGLDRTEALAVSRAYLDTPRLVGANGLLAQVKQRIGHARRGAGRALLFEGAAGAGRSRMLDSAILEAKSRGMIALRAGAKACGPRPFALAQAVTAQLLETHPEISVAAAEASDTFARLFAPSEAAPESHDGHVTSRFRLRELPVESAERAAFQDAVVRWYLQIAREHSLLIAADDIEHADPVSGAWLASLAERARRHQLLILCASLRDVDEANPVFRAIRERSDPVAIEPLNAVQTDELFRSVFGDVPNVPLVSARIFHVALGNPRASMELAQHLVDRGSISYDDGHWTLPAALDAGDLPASMAQALIERVASLSPAARMLAECHALSAYPGLSQIDHAWLTEYAGFSRSQTAIHALLAEGILIGDGDVHRLASDAYTNAIVTPLADEPRSERHRLLAELGLAMGKPDIAIAHHLLHAGLEARALDLLAVALQTDVDRADLTAQSGMSAPRIAAVFEPALEQAIKTGRSVREIVELKRWLCAVSVVADVGYYERHAPMLLATLRRDSGLDDWLALADVKDAGERLTRALTTAAKRHEETAPEARAYRPDEAIKYMVHFVVFSIAVGARVLDAPLIRSLPALLEPFSALSSIIRVIEQNAIATRECSADCQFVQARDRWQKVYDELAAVQSDTLPYVLSIRAAIAYGLGILDAARGSASTLTWAEVLDANPMQRVSAMQLRKVVRLQLGDFEGAEEYRRKAELLALQHNSEQMFQTLAIVELPAYAMACDLTGVGHVLESIKPLAARHPGWMIYQHMGEAFVEMLRGDYPAARVALERTLALCSPDPNERSHSLNAWPASAAVYIDVLVALGELERAYEFGVRTLDECATLGVRTTNDIERALALVEAKRGDCATAGARLDAIIARQCESEVQGLHLGASYEARARIALEAGDQRAFQEFGSLAAREYRYGNNSPLGVRYERLMNEAQRAGFEALPQLSQFATSLLGATAINARTSVETVITHAMRNLATPEERGRVALQLICDAAGTTQGHLYLVSQNALRWIASIDSAPQNDTHLDLARQCLQQTMNEDAATTGVHVDTMSTQSLDGGVVLTAADGIVYRAQTVTGVFGGAVRHAAVAVMTQPEAGRPRPRAAVMLSALASFLLEARDTDGVAAHD